MEHIVVDGRVFATEAADRGMGRYVHHLVLALLAAGRRVTLLIAASPSSGFVIRGVPTQPLPQEGEPLAQSAALNRLLERIGADLYVDGTPFIGPLRYDISTCPVLAVLYDLIPMRFLNDYIAADESELTWYVNGLTRVRKADHVIAISHVVKEHALRYLGIPRTRVDVVPPRIDPAYDACAAAEDGRAARGLGGRGNIVCIQGAHRSKNFPIAIRFLEELSVTTGVAVDVIVPTPSQRVLIDGVRREGIGALRVRDSIPEETKLALQRNARVIAHLSLEEGYGIPLAEALSLDRPIICIDNAINRELLCGEDSSLAGVLLLDDPSLASTNVLDAAATFVQSAGTPIHSAERARIAAALAATRARGVARLARAIDAAGRAFHEWHARAGLAIIVPTDFGSSGVADYCRALIWDGAPRYAILLGAAPRALQLLPHLRLLPFESVEQVRRRAPGLLFHLAATDSLSRTFDELVQRSETGDVLVVHGDGSYLPRLLRDAAERGERSPELERFLRDEPADVRVLADVWLREAAGQWAESEAMIAVIDRRFRSDWLRGFRGVFVSHNAAFAAPAGVIASDAPATLAADSVIRTRTRYAPLPIDDRRTPGVARLADAFRWSLGLTRRDLVVCCMDGIRGGMHLVTVARAVARLHLDRSLAGDPGGVTLLLVGRVFDQRVFELARGEFETRSIAARFVQVDEPDETREDAMLASSDVVVALREHRWTQLGRAYVRALVLGLPVIANDGAAFGDADAAIVCRDEVLEDDLYARLEELARSADLRDRQAALSLSRYREQHTVDRFFERVRALNGNAAAV